MTHTWLSCRLAVDDLILQDSPLPLILTGLVDQLRFTDPASTWRFERTDSHAGSALELRFRSHPAALHMVEAKLRSYLTHQRTMTVERNLSAPASDGHRSRFDAVVDGIAAASSDFALALFAADPASAEDRLSLAVLHLRSLINLVPAEDRLPFLFLCWQHWAGSMTPGERVSSGHKADALTGGFATEAPDFGDDDCWHRYLGALADLTSSLPADSGLPSSYLLFDNAHRTHQRLGIPLALEAVAARIVRLEHSLERPLPGRGAVLVA